MTTDWQPIETAFARLAFEAKEVEGEEVRYYEDALVCGRLWSGGFHESPWRPAGGGFTGDLVVRIARTYSGCPCWTVQGNAGPSDYDDYIKPTHWQPLPPPPTDS